MEKEYLVTAQGYEKNDPYKQTLLLYDTFNAETEKQAENCFMQKYELTHHIINIYSSIGA